MSSQLTRLLIIICAALVLLTIISRAPAQAQRLEWSGIVSSRGMEATGPVLSAGTSYIIVARGNMYFGRWWQNGNSLLNDACYEFAAKGYADPLPVLNSSVGITVCDGLYRSNHVYQSVPFLGDGNRVKFWIFDTDYRDNYGGLVVEVYSIAPAGPSLPPPVAGPPPQSPPPVQHANHILGSWQGCDGRIVTSTEEGGEFVGRYTALGGLGGFGFKINEVGYRLRLQSDGSFTGEVKWRWTDGRSQWRAMTASVSGDVYRDSGSDSCSRQMTRVKRRRYY